MSREIIISDHVSVIKDEEYKVVKGSREDILEQIYQKLEAEYNYTGKEIHLNTLQEIMIRLTEVDESAIFNKKWYCGE